ncbi:hypothetical protein G7067_06955 [Leucobacter insecticola]|uniref:Uncharacterized protein n=1 Tax=Leucobacter insecticola TaxID=2714934 RepID=A0A6G8FIV4_9MICO|nr:hypothetical protein [Leucobacter insecticola]QIM16216.1 hypothetical protein G7067_06935 [Leucobacter insecticola]QIM16219.1 hypothetical protein G7067_06955 [Leucobacter insecticola]
MASDTRGIQEGFHEEARTVSKLTSRVAGTKDGWTRGDNLNVPGAKAVSEIYSDLSELIALYGALAESDAGEFGKFGVNIVVQDKEDADCVVPQ